MSARGIAPFLTAIAIIGLRIVVGLHFFHEGITKVRSGEFSAEPFLQEARGPLRPLYHSLLPDPLGHKRLGVSAGEPWSVQPDRTLALWQHYRDEAIRSAADDMSRTRIELAYERAAGEFREFIALNETEMNAWLNRPQQEANNEPSLPPVDSLLGQARRTDAGNREKAALWFARVKSMWDNYEAALHEIASESRPVELQRPWSPRRSTLDWINRIVPWFDLAVGAMLVVGLFSRFAAVAGMVLLAGVVLAQPFWMPGAVSTFPQWIELAALAVVATVGAGRIGGLDYFLRTRRRERPPHREEIPL
jgi:uncharacterized membrane protein YphA (DoxX/SURF4 family)